MSESKIDTSEIMEKLAEPGLPPKEFAVLMGKLEAIEARR